jgi:hypothetical protein
VCNGTSVVLTPSGAGTFTLYPNNITGTSFTVFPALSTNYSLTGNNGGCISSNIPTSSVTVLPSPTVALTAGSQTICAGASVSLNPGGAINYTLQPGNISGSSFTVTPPSTTIYSLSGTNSQGCLSKNTATRVISVTPIPTVSAANGKMCILGIYTIVPSGASVYTIMPPIPGVISTSLLVSPSVTTTYTIFGAHSNCLAQSPALMTLIVDTSPSISVTMSHPAVCAGKTSTITALGANNYTWSGTSIVGSIPSNTIAATAGSYTVTGAVGACTSTAVITIGTMECTSIVEEENSEEVQVFPNPNTGELFLKTSDRYINKTFQLYDALGQKVLSGVINSRYLRIEISLLSRGVYSLHIGETFYSKIIKN